MWLRFLVLMRTMDTEKLGKKLFYEKFNSRLYEIVTRFYEKACIYVRFLLIYFDKCVVQCDLNDMQTPSAIFRHCFPFVQMLCCN